MIWRRENEQEQIGTNQRWRIPHPPSPRHTINSKIKIESSCPDNQSTSANGTEVSYR
jgi:hypothetical protein